MYLTTLELFWLGGSLDTTSKSHILLCLVITKSSPCVVIGLSAMKRKEKVSIHLHTVFDHLATILVRGWPLKPPLNLTHAVLIFEIIAFFI